MLIQVRESVTRCEVARMLREKRPPASATLWSGKLMFAKNNTSADSTRVGILATD